MDFPVCRMASDVRTPPIGAVYAKFLPRVLGKCDWCGEACEDRTPVRKQLRQTHYNCDAEIQIIKNPSAARYAVLRRDKGICVDCREDWSEKYRYVPRRIGGAIDVILAQAVPNPNWPSGYYVATRSRWHPTIPPEYFEFVEVVAVSLWHVDHKIPLWKARHMPPVQRIEYFKLANLITRCERCHTFKSKREAAERAKFNGMAEDAAGTNKPARKSKWPKGRKIQSAGFQRGHRPMRGRRK